MAVISRYALDDFLKCAAEGKASRSGSGEKFQSAFLVNQVMQAFSTNQRQTVCPLAVSHKFPICHLNA